MDFRKSKKIGEYIMSNDNPASTESLSETFENEFLRKFYPISSWSGSNGAWKILVNFSFINSDTFIKCVKEFANGILYMHFDNVALIDTKNGNYVFFVSLK